jgi:MarR family transcriptional regulator for hemolysin
VSLVNNLGFLLKDLARMSSKNFERRAVAEELGLTLEQCRVLVYLEENQGITQAGLASLTETDPMTLVRILDHMEKFAWIERRLDPADRRVRRLHLLPAATPMLKRIWVIADESRSDALSGLDPAQIETLLQLLNTVQGNLAALVPTASGVGLRQTATDSPIASAAKSSRRKVRGGK